MKLNLSSIFSEQKQEPESIQVTPPNPDGKSYIHLNEAINKVYNMVCILGHKLDDPKLVATVASIQKLIEKNQPTTEIDYDKFYAAVCCSSNMDIKGAIGAMDCRATTALLTYSSMDPESIEYAYANRIPQPSDAELFHYNRYCATLELKYTKHLEDMKNGIHNPVVDFREAFRNSDIDGMVEASNRMSHAETNTFEIVTMYIDIFYNTLRYKKEEMTVPRYNALHTRINHCLSNIQPTDAIDYDKYYIALCNYNSWTLVSMSSDRTVEWKTAMLQRTGITKDEIESAIEHQVKYDINCHKPYHYDRYIATLQRVAKEVTYHTTDVDATHLLLRTKWDNGSIIQTKINFEYDSPIQINMKDCKGNINPSNLIGKTVDIIHKQRQDELGSHALDITTCFIKIDGKVHTIDYCVKPDIDKVHKTLTTGRLPVFRSETYRKVLQLFLT